MGKIRGRILTPDNLSELARLVTEELNQHTVESESEIEPIRHELSEASKKLERLLDAVEEGKLPFHQLAPLIAERKEGVDKLRTRLSELEITVAGQKVEPAGEEEIRELAADLKALLEKSSIAERRTFVKSFVMELTVTGDKSSLTYTLPILPAKVADESVTVPGIVQHGGRFWIRTRDPSLIRTVL